jgi:predicted NAD/FAD-binding protein
LVYQQFSYQHPVFDDAALNAQKQLWSLQGKQRTWFCGSYFGYGFHEDGIQSGLAVAEQLGGNTRPWSSDRANDRIYLSLSKSLDAAA